MNTVKTIYAIIGILILTTTFSCSKTELIDDNSLLEDSLKNGKGKGKGRGLETGTAQSTMIRIDGEGEYMIDRESNWVFDEQCSRDKFSITTTGCPPESEIEEALNEALNLNYCTFWNGGHLVGLTRYGKVDCNGITLKDVWTVDVIPTIDTVDPQTCWQLIVGGNGGTQDVTFNIIIAGESYMKGSNFDKYSFTLLDGEGNPRIENLRIKLVVDGDTILNEPLPYEIILGADSNNCLGDILYYGNAGINYNPDNDPSIMEKLHTPLYPNAQGEATIEQILLSDTFTNNDDICSAAAIGLATWTFEDLPSGDYEIFVSGKCKGVSAPDVPITQTRMINIGLEDCQ